ncbi:Anhydro-N-acetylmuramic acid kinase-AnhMurNAc kinase [Moritella viscosa]|uniref:Anhydro-N-acetylmuramic acid kinase n=1 Tax=Moritella viscosa TaxID=80854 RepID=A0A090IMD1_9GAMM|nr:anhydro-N-acetylmuramic acid kinase [Moritella viscosa]CED61594.1 anhydro-N-acetylmuramic acid kinase [Moritella viscosa]SGY98015.1 Anhydro-N-acetylmuramic acid kinase-AnhMurNAc kinase [Moritella viscosa]SHO05073.1 Anhydro-N-acetylmuramic acid kinase-AnhMurNAc kinase [Moritella viscosa]SHO05080.1 Anhydro-N-acetylmuramic acid kinase-AnhMurNAc kinase [Moritella viscosa]SHO05992.1 Anhydro-N-acetylmuramic acid kinase-AnhMurNAc kinase [Moritella viscosa]
MPNKRELYIGLMSGTSIDGIDAALVAFEHGKCELIAQHLQVMPAKLTAQLHQLCRPNDNEISTLAIIDQPLAQAFALACQQLLAKTPYTASDITAIGSHGQTIRHHPEHSFTLQIGDANVLAALTNIDTVADFRRKDMALGGQGAPLVPAFHQAVFQHQSINRAIVNIGGLANITYLPSLQQNKSIIGYDTGPGNTLLDAWFTAKNNSLKSYDEDGQWAKSGLVIESLLTSLLKHEFFALVPPKSTGRELFNLAWLQGYLDILAVPYSNADVQRTLTRFTAVSVANEVNKLMLSNNDGDINGEVYICGGGAANPLLMADLALLLPVTPVMTTTEIGIDPNWVEAIAFAWLAKQHIHKLPGNLPAVTGASRLAVLGAFYPAG